MKKSVATAILPGMAQGPVIATSEPLSFWGGIDPATAIVIDVHHPLHGRCLSGAVVLMPSTRGSCTGSGVLLDMVLNGRAPAALVFCEAEDVVTLGALIAAEMFGKMLPVLRLDPQDFAALSREAHAQITVEAILGDNFNLRTHTLPSSKLELTATDHAMLAGEEGPAPQLAMRILTKMAAAQGATRLIDVTQGHIDGCIYASPANLTFAQAMADLGATVRIPTTMNAISVDHQNWRAQGVPDLFGGPAQRLADAYTSMGCQASFTCAPYLLDSAPVKGELIAWSESNAVIYANSVLGARTGKHPDFLDLCIALTGRAPLTGVYLDEHRAAQRVLSIDLPTEIDDAFWPLVGWLAGRLSPDRIPLLQGLAEAAPSHDDLKALCAAFGTTSAAPMLHVEGITSEADNLLTDADHRTITRLEMAESWRTLNAGPELVDLIAIGSPHASFSECRALAVALMGRQVVIPTIVTAGRKVIEDARASGTLDLLKAAGVQVIPDLCWCSISEPVFPVATRNVMTNSGKYAHYGPGLSGRQLRFGSLADCAQTATTGHAPQRLPHWLEN